MPKPFVPIRFPRLAVVARTGLSVTFAILAYRFGPTSWLGLLFAVLTPLYVHGAAMAIGEVLGDRRVRRMIAEDLERIRVKRLRAAGQGEAPGAPVTGAGRAGRSA